MHRRALACLFLVMFAAAVAAQPRNAEEYARTLEGAERVSRLQVDRVIADLELKRGDRVADIGAGSGLFTRRMAQAVAPDGVAFAVDIDRGLLEIVARTAGEQHIGNVKTIAASPDDPALPEAVDLALICDTLHHISHPKAYLATLKRYIKPGGRVAIIDYASQWPPAHETMRYELGDLRTWMREAGFVEVAQHGYLAHTFYVIWRNGPA
jgi:arsenite methyltransferase